MTEPYDSTADTLDHIRTVRRYLKLAIDNLDRRAVNHDASKLAAPEKEAFDVATPKLAGLTYGSDEYKAALRELGPALEHHYAHNSHHPEHYGGKGIAGMSLFDLVEMLMDWKAASERHNDGDIRTSIEHNVGRFLIEPQLAEILRNTAREMGW